MLEQDKLKMLLQTAVHKIEAGQFTSLEETIGMMAQAFQEFMPAFAKES